jgi:hypothetical protein
LPAEVVLEEGRVRRFEDVSLSVEADRASSPEEAGPIGLFTKKPIPIPITSAKNGIVSFFIQLNPSGSPGGCNFI